MFLDRSFWSELVADHSRGNAMELDRIKAYSAYVRVALNNLMSVAHHNGIYGSTGDSLVDREVSIALHSLRAIERRFGEMHRDSQRAGGNLRNGFNVD